MRTTKAVAALWLAAGLALGAGCRSAPVERATVHEVDAVQAAKVLDAWSSPFVLDVSPPDDYASGHIAGAVNIPRSQLWFRMYDVPADQSTVILVYDSHGERAGEAAQQLRDEGYFRVYRLRGGLDAWRAAGLPVEP